MHRRYTCAAEFSTNLIGGGMPRLGQQKDDDAPLKSYRTILW
jgi:hypothetical protein